MFDQVRFARHHRVVVHPNQHGVKVVAAFGDIPTANDHVTATGVNFVFQCQRDAKRREGFVQISVVSDDLFDF